MTTIEVFTSEDCGQCDAVLERAETVAADADAEVKVRDVEDDRSLALEYGVFSVPTMVVDGETTLRGVPAVEEIEAAVGE